MTEQTTTERAEAGPKRCLMGCSTEAPCPFPATERVLGWSDKAPQLCTYHAATEPLVEEESDLRMALEELLPGWEKRADELGNRPLHDLLFRARQELEQRLALVSGVLEDLEAAERRLFRR